MNSEKETPFNKPNTAERRSRVTNPTPYSGLGKLPPQATDLEEAVLGGLMLERIDETIWPMINPEIFYRDNHKKIANAILLLHRENSPIDILTITAKLRALGELEMVGGAYYITELTNRVASSANLEYHLRIIYEKFIQRETIRISTEAINTAYEDTSDIFDLIAKIGTEIKGLVKGLFVNKAKDSKQLADDLREDLLKEKLTGLLGPGTGIQGLDYVLKGDAPGDFRLIEGATSMGKAQPLNCKVLTPFGFVEIGSLKPGDIINDSSGGLQEVKYITPQGVKKTYRVIFNDKTETKCCDEHLWLTLTRNEKSKGVGPTVKSLKQIRETLKISNNKRVNHAVQFIEPVFYEKKQLKIDPYLLGVLLGDGCFPKMTLTNSERDIIEKCEKLLPFGCEIINIGEIEYRLRGINITKERKHNPLIVSLIEYGLKEARSGDKFIPDDYLKSSIEDRLQLLRGLIDTDGYVVNQHCIEIGTVSEKLKDGIIDLVRSLGGRATFKTSIGKYKKDGVTVICQLSYRVNLSFTNDIIPVSSKKHLSRYAKCKQFNQKMIIDIIEDESVGCACIAVSSKDRLYITDDYILTHNSALACSEVVSCCFEWDKAGRIKLREEQIPVAVFNLEMTSLKYSIRLLANISSIDKEKIALGKLNKQEHERYMHYLDMFEQAKIHIDDCDGGITINEFEFRVADLVQKHGVYKFYIDTLQLMKPDPALMKINNTRELQLADISRRVKALAKKHGIVMIPVAQLSDEVRKAKNNKPTLGMIRECKAIEHDADNVIFVWRPFYYEELKESLKEINCSLFNIIISDFYNMAFLIVAKNREGDLGIIPVKFIGDLMRVCDHPDVLDKLEKIRYDEVNENQKLEFTNEENPVKF